MDKYSQRQPRGQGLLEYALIIVFVFLIVLSALHLFGVDVLGGYQYIVDRLFGGPTSELTSTMVPGEGTTMPDGNEGTGTPSPEILLAETFDGDLSTWTALGRPFWRGTATTENGSLVANPLSALLMTGVTGSDYVVNVNSTALTQTRPTYQGFGVFFRASNPTSLDGYIFEVEQVNRNREPTILFRRWENGVQINNPISSASLPVNYNWSNPGDIQIIVQGNTFTAYINGESVLTGTDSTFSQGSVGLASNYGSRMTVDGISVESIP